jgi:hypothetical protein
MVHVLSGVVWESVRIVRLGRLSDLLALKTKIEGINFFLYRGTLAQIWC